MKKKLSGLTVARLLLSGAIVGIAFANLMGIPVPSLGVVPPELLSASGGAAAAAAAMKLAHLF